MRLLEEAKLFLNILFQSTHSLRSATTLQSLLFCRINVSIHALLAECDKRRAKRRRSRSCFNPRTPCGVRQSSSGERSLNRKFQSTHSLRSATRGPGHSFHRQGVSIHALLAECDSLECRKRRIAQGFNPRTPCGVRPRANATPWLKELFQSTHSLRSATNKT